MIQNKWNRRSHRRCYIKKGVLKKIAKFTGLHLCQGLAQTFYWEFFEIFKNTFFTEHLWTTTSGEDSWICWNRSMLLVKIREYVKKDLMLQKVNIRMLQYFKRNYYFLATWLNYTELKKVFSMCHKNRVIVVSLVSRKKFDIFETNSTKFSLKFWDFQPQQRGTRRIKDRKQVKKNLTLEEFSVLSGWNEK